MLKPLYTWILFGLCLLIVLAAMGWISWTVLRLDRAEEDARRREMVEERVRLALWRMDAVGSRIVAAEAARPVGFYGRQAPLPAAPPVSAWFELDADGHVRWQTGNLPDLDRLASPAPPPTATAVRQQDLADARTSERQQRVANVIEYNARQRVVSQQLEQTVEDAPAPAPGPGEAMQPRWAGDTLVLVRRVTVAEQPRTQGCVLDSADLHARLLVEAVDILPHAQLRRGAAGTPAEPGRRLVSLPLVLDPGADPIPYVWRRPWSSSQLMLVIAWSLMLLPAAGLALLLIAAVSLSERRGAFVSAVTHELRTPLTTFRMYTEMLAEGMVPPERQHEYIATLRTEADRLSHMVENVLAYARLERGRRQDEMETVDLATVVDRCAGQLRDRAERADMAIELPPVDAGVKALADPGAIERIVCNLVDNACKYGRGEEPRLTVSVATEGSCAVLRVRDRGPGIDGRGRKQLFKPFHKSASEAARSAPGVGLGLALSQRLARRMGGDLVIEDVTPGACFALRLPAA